MTTELTFSSVFMPFPKWRRLIDETARLDMPLARRLVVVRIIWEESYLTDAQLQSRFKDLLGLDCLGDDGDVTIASDIAAVQQVFLAAGHELVYSDEPGRTGYWVKGRPRLDQKMAQEIRGAIAEIDLEQVRRWRRMTTTERFQIAADLSDAMAETAIYRIMLQNPGMARLDAIRLVRERTEQLDKFRL